MKIEIENFTFYNADNIEIMKQYPDKYFDLAVVDPPYGIDIASKFGGEKRKSGKGAAMKTAFTKKNWDLSIPELEYFSELFRVSKDQIIWGANYFTQYLPNSMGWIVWDKNNGTTKFSDCELAFSSFDSALRMFKYTWNGMIQEDMKNKEIRFHPTQKPIALYDWIFSKYATEGMKILDTHLGSNSIAIAVDNANELDKKNLSFVGIEIDKEYFDAGMKRFTNHKQQITMEL